MPRLRSDKIYGKTQNEIELLLRLISPHIRDVECGSGKRGVFLERRNAAWKTIGRNFNASPKCTCQSTVKQLQSIWTQLKSRMRKHRRDTPLNEPLEDRISSAVEKLLKNNDASVHIRNAHSSPPSETSGSSTISIAEESDDIDVYPASLESAPQQSTSQITAEKKNPAGFHVAGTSVLERRVSLATPGTPCGQNISQDRRHHGQIVGQPFGHSQATTFRPIASTMPTVQPTSVVTALPVHQIYARKMSPSLNTSYGQVTPNSLQQAQPIVSIAQPLFKPPSRQHSSGTHPAQEQQAIQSVPQSAVRVPEEMVRLYHLQEVQARLQIQEIQALSQMDKSLHETKMRTEQMVEKWAKELHAAKMNATLVALDRRAAFDKKLQERDDELHSAKMRAEEMTSQMRTELHDLQMQTAKVENQRAEINKQIIELKLQQVLLELQQCQENCRQSI